MSNLKKILSHGAIYAAAAILARVISFVMLPIYTRALSPSEYGVVDLLDTTAAIIVNLAGVAITYSVMRFYYDYETPAERGGVVSTALIGLTAVGSVAIALAWPLAPMLSTAMFHSTDYALAIRVMAISAVLYGLIEVPMTFIRALERPGLYIAISLGRLLLGLVLNVVFVVWLRWGVMGVVYATFGSSLVTVLGLAVFTFPKTGFQFSKSILAKILRFGLPFIPGSLAMLVLHNGDRYILNQYRPLSEVGIYSLGYKLGMIATYALSVPFANVWSTRMYTVTDEPGGHETYAKVATYYIYAQLLAWLALASASNELVGIAASPEFAGAAAFVPIIAGGYLLREVSDFWKNAFLIKKRTSILAWIQPITAVFNVGVTFLLVRYAGAIGAAWATLLTFVLLLVITLVPAERVLPTEVRPRMIASAVAAAAALFVLSRFVPAMPIAPSLVSKIAITLLFPVALIAMRAVPAEDRVMAIAWMHKMKLRWTGPRGGGGPAAPRGSVNP